MTLEQAKQLKVGDKITIKHKNFIWIDKKGKQREDNIAEVYKEDIDIYVNIAYISYIKVSNEINNVCEISYAPVENCELVATKNDNNCHCDIKIIMSVGCKCGGY